MFSRRKKNKKKVGRESKNFLKTTVLSRDRDSTLSNTIFLPVTDPIVSAGRQYLTENVQEYDQTDFPGTAAGGYVRRINVTRHAPRRTDFGVLSSVRSVQIAFVPVERRDAVVGTQPPDGQNGTRPVRIRIGVVPFVFPVGRGGGFLGEPE